MQLSDSCAVDSDRHLWGIPYILVRSAEIHPDRVAVCDLHNKVSATYGQLNADTNRLARALRRLGIQKGDRVALMFTNELAVVQAMFACAKIGAVVCPVNARLLPHEVDVYLAPHGIKGILCNASFCASFQNTPATVRVAFQLTDHESGVWCDAHEIMAAESDEPLRPVTSVTDPFRMIPTGGTTGASKGVVHSHGGTLMTIAANIAEFGIRRGWKTLLIAPLYHGAAMDWAFFPILWRSGTVILPEDKSFNPQKFLACIRERKVEFCLVVPAVINALYDAWDKVPLDCVRSVVTTSAPTSPALRAKLNELFSAADVMAGAGISESLNMAVQSPGELLSYPASIGEAHLDTRMCIVDADGRVLPRNQVGEICLRGFNTAHGYCSNPEATKKTWRVRANDSEGLEWCFTGDIGVMDDEGRLSIIDRSKDVIITGGETVPSIEIESAYAGHPSIAECAAVGLPDERWGEAITLVVAKSDSQVVDEELAKELFEYGRKQLAGYKIPKQIAFMSALPRTHMGKLMKQELRAREYSMLYQPK